MRRLIPLVAFALIALGSDPAFALLPSLSTGTAPPGWYGPIVPRNTADATNGSALLPFQLTSMTYFNWSVFQNAAVQGTWRDEFYLDGQLIQLVTRSNNEFASRWWLSINTGPMLVPGGRHTVKISTDPGNQVGESYDFRGDNIWFGQYLWQPAPLAPGSSLTTIPPEGTPDFNDPPNCNAFAFTRTPGTAWVVSLGTNLPNAGFPLVVYDDYVNSTTGLSNERGRSTRIGLTNFVVGAATGTPATVYPTTLRPTGSGGAGVPIAIAGADASGRQSSNGVGLWPSVNLPANQSAHVYEAYLTAGYGESAILTRFMGSSDLEVTVFPPGIPVMSRAQAQWISIPRDGAAEYDDFAFTPPTTGWYLFVVGRVDGQSINEASGYRFEMMANGTVGVPPTYVAAPLSAAPSPAVGPMQLSFALARPEHARLEVFDLAGRAVRRLEDGALPAGPHTRVWDGLDDRGAAVAPGRYWARLTAGSRRESLSLVRVR